MKINREYRRAVERQCEGLPPRDDQERDLYWVWAKRHAEEIAAEVNSVYAARGSKLRVWWDKKAGGFIAGEAGAA